MYGVAVTTRNQSDKFVTPSCHGGTNTQRFLSPSMGVFKRDPCQRSFADALECLQAGLLVCRLAVRRRMWSEFSSKPLECSVSQPGKVSGATLALNLCLISSHQSETNH